MKSEPVSQVSQLTGQVALLREVVEQKDSTIDKLIHSHGIEAGELRKQVEHFKQQVAETKESLCARLAAVEEVCLHTLCVCECLVCGSLVKCCLPSGARLSVTPSEGGQHAA